MRPINRFLLDHGLRIIGNPCISPDYCLDWPALVERLAAGHPSVQPWPRSGFRTAEGAWTLLEDRETGDCAWRLEGAAGSAECLEGGVTWGSARVFPASWENLLRLKDLVLAHTPGSTLFPTATETLGRRTLGVGARFTTLHWPAVEWAMRWSIFQVCINYKSIPRVVSSCYQQGVFALAMPRDCFKRPVAASFTPRSDEASQGAILGLIRKR
jgi:hypothetical protein